MQSVPRGTGTTGRVTAIATSVVSLAAAAWLTVLVLRSNPRVSATPLAIALLAAVWIAGLAPGILALLYHTAVRDRVLRRSAERNRAQSHRIAELTLALAQARTPGAAIEAAVLEPLHALGADAGIVWLISGDGRNARATRAVGYQPSTYDEEMTLERKTPISDAVARGAPVFVESVAAFRGEYPNGRNRKSEGRSQATTAIPLLIGSRVAAVVQLDFADERPFSGEDREYVFAVATRAAQALDRTWQHEAALRARTEAESLRERADAELRERQKVETALRASESRYRALAARTSRLHSLTAGLSEAVTVHAVAEAVVHQGRLAAGATHGEVTLLAEHGTMFEMLHSDGEGVAPGQPSRFPVEAGWCATRAVETRKAVFVRSFAEWQERYWRSASVAADGGYVSSATLPLLVEGTPIGVVAFYFTAPVNFDEEYEALLISVAQHCAQALDRARLYESAEEARAEAETANRLKDDFVSIVSHELRTPLNAILGWATMLQKRNMDGATTARALQSIHDNATRQARLIDELLDFSRIVSGRMTLSVEEIDLRALLRGVVESIIPSAAASGITLDVGAMPPLHILGDANRLEQVFFNLLGNALKFTPSGGRIAIGIQTTGNSVEVRVSDTGSGIDSSFLPHVFDRFRQGDSATTREHGGLGLGLSIARELVEAHKGTISVDSAGKDHGATFIVTLPLLEAEVESASASRGPMRGNPTVH